MGIGQKNLVDLPGGGGDKPPKAEKVKAAPPTQSADRDLRGRLEAVFVRIADAAEARGDLELSEILREDSPVMATGLVSLTRPVRALRTPIVMALGFVEPFMAFSRVVRVMLGRVMDRRGTQLTDDDPGVPRQ